MTRLPYTSLPVKEERGSSARICSQMSARLRLSLAGPTISFLVFYLATVSIFIPSRVFLQTNKSHPHHMKNEFHAIFPREIYIYIYIVQQIILVPEILCIIHSRNSIESRVIRIVHQQTDLVSILKSTIFLNRSLFRG